MTDSGAAEVVLALFARPFYAFQGGPFAFLLELKIASQLRRELARRAQENGVNKRWIVSGYTLASVVTDRNWPGWGAILGRRQH